ncbi:DNA polymerase III subunit delta [Dissulfurispira thermophila]|uniref:DNA polymerase III subunit delta n=2 Tax=root TaxID=1 RepID=A0A7G1GZ33_9BACT|nr:DNA polymerase III subunit delta [Dissulfurispira thermophila]BCB95249.1 DNA polymerase III subunit delta [Dissulfurispira thermophila]
MSIKQLHIELSNGFPSPSYLFYSSDDFLLYEIKTLIKDKYHSDTLNLDIFDAGSSENFKPIEQIIDILNTMPFLSTAKRRVVIIENTQKLTKKNIEKLSEYLINPSNTSLLIMLFEGTSPKLFNAISTENIKVIGLNVQEKDIPSWIKSISKKFGIDFTDRAIDYLISCVGTDLGMLYSEIEKFSSCSIRKIDIDDIKDMVYTSAEYNAFDLFDALKKKEVAEAFRIFENVGKNTESQMLLGALNYQYANLQGKPHHKSERFFRTVFKLLHEADTSIKTSHPYVIEDLLIKLLKAEKMTHRVNR